MFFNRSLQLYQDKAKKNEQLTFPVHGRDNILNESVKRTLHRDMYFFMHSVSVFNLYNLNHTQNDEENMNSF